MLESLQGRGTIRGASVPHQIVNRTRLLCQNVGCVFFQDSAPGLGHHPPHPLRRVVGESRVEWAMIWSVVDRMTALPPGLRIAAMFFK